MIAVIALAMIMTTTTMSSDDVSPHGRRESEALDSAPHPRANQGSRRVHAPVRRSRLIRPEPTPKWRYIGGFLVVAGCFLPWVSIGTSSSKIGLNFLEGFLCLAAAGSALLLTLSADRSRRIDAMKNSRFVSIGAGLVCIVAPLVAIPRLKALGKEVTDLVNELRRALPDLTTESPIAQLEAEIRFGLYLTIAGGVMLLLAAIFEPVIPRQEDRAR